MSILFNPACGSCSCSVSGDIYLGGSFIAAGASSRNGQCLVSKADGSADAFVSDLGVASLVRAAAYDSTGGWIYVGGDFTTINGVSQPRMARINATTGDVDATWAVTVDARVVSVLIFNDFIYIGGSFSTVNGSTRNGGACFDSAGNLQAWDPNLSLGGFIGGMVASGTTVYIGGDFTTVGGVTRLSLATVDATSGALAAFNPNLYSAVIANPVVYDIFISSTGLIYIGGFFDKVGGAAGTPRRAAACFNAAGTLQTWNPDPNYDLTLQDPEVYTIAEDSAGLLYLGGSFEQIGLTARYCLAAVDTSGTVQAFDPNPSYLVDDMVIDDTVIYLAGQFTTVGGTTRYGAASCDLSGVLQSWDPNLTYFSATPGTAEVILNIA